MLFWYTEWKFQNLVQREMILKKTNPNSTFYRHVLKKLSPF